MKSSETYSQRGFTLIELMVVIAVIGILATIGVTNLSGAQASSRDAQRKTDLASYNLALERYYAANAIYPVADDTNDYRDVSAPTPTGIFAPSSPLLLNGFMGAIPPDPSSQVNPELAYRYTTDYRGLRYVLYARLEAGSSTWWIHYHTGTTEASSIEPTSP